jgi:hypothetical protein
MLEQETANWKTREALFASQIHRLQAQLGEEPSQIGGDT